MSEIESWRQSIEAAAEGAALKPGVALDGSLTPIQDVQA